MQASTMQVKITGNLFDVLIEAESGLASAGLTRKIARSAACHARPRRDLVANHGLLLFVNDCLRRCFTHLDLGTHRLDL